MELKDIVAAIWKLGASGIFASGTSFALYSQNLLWVFIFLVASLGISFLGGAYGAIVVFAIASVVFFLSNLPWFAGASIVFCVVSIVSAWFGHSMGIWQ